jgi:hypothetical protein
MRFGWKIFWFAGAVVWGARAIAAPMTTVPVLEFSQDGEHFTRFDALERRRKVARYYEYHDKTGHPEFGTAHDTGTAAIYWDYKRKALSLLLISGGPVRR